MSTPHDEYIELDLPEGQHIAACPVCGAAGSLWQFQVAASCAASKVIMCVNGETFGPQDGIQNEGCLLYMPPPGAYKATIREAIKYWNEYAKALTAQRRARNWQTAKVLRSAATTGEGDAP